MRADERKFRRIAHQLRGQTYRIFEAQVFTIDDVIGLLGIPGEPFVEINFQVKPNSPSNIRYFAATLTRAGPYIPMPNAYLLGRYYTL